MTPAPFEGNHGFDNAMTVCNCNIPKLRAVVKNRHLDEECLEHSKPTAQRVDQQSIIALALRIQKLAKEPDADAEEVLATALAEVRALLAEYPR